MSETIVLCFLLIVLSFCQANIADFGDNQWVTCFQESAETLLGQNSGYLGQLKDSVSFFFQSASHSFFFLRFPSVCYMKVWPQGLASILQRRFEKQYIVYELEFFLWCVYEIAF